MLSDVVDCSPGDAIHIFGGRQRLGISFLDLPVELRLMIYRYNLIAPFQTIKPPSKEDTYIPTCVTPVRDKSIEEIDALIRRHRADHQSYRQLFQSYTDYRSVHTGGTTLGLSLLRLSKTIHAEAADILYGQNALHFVLAITGTYPPGEGQSFHPPPRYKFRDNMTVLPEGYMKRIKRCSIEVRLPTFPWASAKKLYLQYYARLATFATCFGGDHHSLGKVTILFNRFFTRESYFPLSCLRTSQNVLETLAAIHGVRESVTVRGVTPAFEGKLSRAMMSKELAYVPMERKYGKRTGTIRGKRYLQRYSLDRYYDSRLVWSQSALGPYPLHTKMAPPAYKCCEVCDEKPRLRFRRIIRAP